MAAYSVLPLVLSQLLLLMLPRLSVSISIDNQKQAIVDFHNDLRRHVVPRAADMNAMKWDDSLAALAQTAVDTCVFAHNYGGAFAGKGENLYRGGKTNFTEILMFMFLEREIYDHATGTCKPGPNTKYPMFKACGHYLQIATASVVLVGCAIKRCGDNYLAACEYNSGYGSPPYKAGEPGSQCGHFSAGYEYDRLCYSKMSYMPPAPAGVTLNCKLRCQNGGTVTENGFVCKCTCPSSFYGSQCQFRSATGALSLSCSRSDTPCMNGGTPVQVGNSCSCSCPAAFTGDLCEEDKKILDNSAYWYFGKEIRYQSYYPIKPNILDSMPVKSSLIYYVTEGINHYCKSNLKVCCPESSETTTDKNFVNFNSLKITPGYPADAIDGSLILGIYFEMDPFFASSCNLGIAPLVNHETIKSASQTVKIVVKTLLGYYGLHVVKVY